MTTRNYSIPSAHPDVTSSPSARKIANYLSDAGMTLTKAIKTPTGKVLLSWVTVTPTDPWDHGQEMRRMFDSMAAAVRWARAK